MCDICSVCGESLDYSENSGFWFCDNVTCSMRYVTTRNVRHWRTQSATVREHVNALESPVARQLLGDCCDDMETAIAWEQGFEPIAVESADIDYPAQERELRILIYTQQIENGRELEFLK